MAMKYYIVGEIEVRDPSWVPAYVENVTKLVEQRGGRYLARTNKVEKMEGERRAPALLVLIEWSSLEAAKTFYESEEYRPYRQSRIDGARNELVLVAGEDIARAATIAG
jgi:uncharacterized protein (DUF1330 family)